MPVSFLLLRRRADRTPRTSRKRQPFAVDAAVSIMGTGMKFLCFGGWRVQGSGFAGFQVTITQLA